MSETMESKHGITILPQQVWLCDLAPAIAQTIIGLDGPDHVVAKSAPAVTNRYNSWHISRLSRLVRCPVLGDMTKYVIVTPEQKKKFLCPPGAEVYWSPKWEKHGCPASLADWRKGEDSRYLWRVPAFYDAWEPIEPKEPKTIHMHYHPIGTYCTPLSEQMYPNSEIATLWEKVTCHACLINGSRLITGSKTLQKRMQELGVRIPTVRTIDHIEPKPEHKLFPIEWLESGAKVADSHGVKHFASRYPLVDGYRICGFTSHADWTLGMSSRYTPFNGTPFNGTTNLEFAIGQLEKTEKSAT